MSTTLPPVGTAFNPAAAMPIFGSPPMYMVILAGLTIGASLHAADRPQSA